MTAMRNWFRQLAIWLYDLTATNDSEKFLALVDRAQMCDFWANAFLRVQNSQLEPAKSRVATATEVPMSRGRRTRPRLTKKKDRT